MASVASFYDLQAEKPSGEKINFAVSTSIHPRDGEAQRALIRTGAEPPISRLQDLKGKVVLCTNTATKCGLTRQ